MKLIDKDAVLSEIKMYKNSLCDRNGNLENIESNSVVYDTLSDLEGTIDALEVINFCEQTQYNPIKASIQIHASDYSFNIESKLFNQLTKEQQELWRKEIEQAYISGGELGIATIASIDFERIEEETKPDDSSTPMKALGLHKRTNYKR